MLTYSRHFHLDLSPEQQAQARQIVLRRVIGEVIETRGESIAANDPALKKAIEKVIDDCAEEWSLGMSLLAATYHDNGERKKVADAIHKAKDKLLSKTQFVDGPVIMMAELQGDDE